MRKGCGHGQRDASLCTTRPSAAPGAIMRKLPMEASSRPEPCAIMMSAVNSAHIGSQAMASWIHTQDRDMAGTRRSWRCGGRRALGVDGQHAFVPGFPIVGGAVFGNVEAVRADVEVADARDRDLAIGFGVAALHVQFLVLPMAGRLADAPMV